ncbi:MAG: acyl-phosphate glycerol 3-phosphate acyltransferase [Acidobacteria bacterium]|nr:MAG: acyl-phosphate glycerol 3-phosphate acyltransferase [Acidobacteriota bacterium]
MTGPLTTLAAYLLGSIPFGYLIVRWKRGIDVRGTGSRSIGATNVMRNLGVPGFLATFVLDFGKGALAVLLASKLTATQGHDDPRWIAAAAVAAVLGHIAPVWLRFRGGKGVATGVGVFLALAPVPMGLGIAIFAALVAVWRYISLGSIVATAAFPLLVYFLDHPPLPIVLGATGASALIIAQHHSNIRRLLSGTESKVGKKKSEVRSQKSEA